MTTKLLLLTVPAALAFSAAAWINEHRPQHAVGQCFAIDGDTLSCVDGARLRLNGIDAPEMPGHCRRGRHCAPGDPFASKAALAADVDGRWVSYDVLKVDRYERLVVEARANGVDLSCAQLQSGHAIYRGDWDERKLVAACKH